MNQFSSQDKVAVQVYGLAFRFVSSIYMLSNTPSTLTEKNE